MSLPDPNLANLNPEERHLRRRALASALGTGMKCFYGIALVSLVNSFLYRAGEDYILIGGLGATQFVDGFSAGLAREFHAQGSLLYPVAAGALNALIVGFLVLAGLLGARAHRPAIVFGMLLVAADETVLVWAQDWKTAALHVLALWFLWNSVKAATRLHALPAPAAPEIAPEPPSPEPSDPAWSSDGEVHEPVFEVLPAPEPRALPGPEQPPPPMPDPLPELVPPAPPLPPEPEVTAVPRRQRAERSTRGVTHELSRAQVLVTGVVLLGVVTFLLVRLCQLCDEAANRQ